MLLCLNAYSVAFASSFRALTIPRDGLAIVVGAAPRQAVALQQQRRVGRTSLGRLLQLRGQRRRDRHADALVLACGAVLAAALRATARHRQARLRAAVQVLDQEPRGLRGPRAGRRKHIDEQAELGIVVIARGNQPAHVAIAKDDVAGDGGIRQRLQPGFPCISVLDALVVRGGES